MNKKQKKRLTVFITLIVGLLIAGGIIWIAFQSIVSADDSIVTRKFSSTTVNAGDEVNVALSTSVRGREIYYALEEYIPDGWVITNNGGGGSNLKWIVIQNAQGTTYSYGVKAPDKKGNYYFDGVYMFEDFTKPKTTKGQTVITVI